MWIDLLPRVHGVNQTSFVGDIVLDRPLRFVSGLRRQFNSGFRLAWRHAPTGVEHANAEIRGHKQHNDGTAATYK